MCGEPKMSVAPSASCRSSDAPGQEVDVHMQKVVPGAGGEQLKEVKADAPAAARGAWKRGKGTANWPEPARRQVVSLAALAGQAGGGT